MVGGANELVGGTNGLVGSADEFTAHYLTQEYIECVYYCFIKDWNYLFRFQKKKIVMFPHMIRYESILTRFL